jgi:endonuclease YncB( thermonuclease family)
MNKKLLVTTALLAIGVSILSTNLASASTTITKVYDGDTITLSTGEKVRLIQIDTPELASEECFGEEARSALVTLLKSPGPITLKVDPKLDKVDRYGRLLRYVFIGKTNINLKLVEIGAAAPYFYKGEKGQFSALILKAAQNAKAKSIGIWKSCPRTVLAPNYPLSASKAANVSTANAVSSNAKCDPNYAGCIPISQNDMDCADIKGMGLAPVKVVGVDMHKLDRDGDGIGCDS